MFSNLKKIAKNLVLYGSVWEKEDFLTAIYVYVCMVTVFAVETKQSLLDSNPASNLRDTLDQLEFEVSDKEEVALVMTVLYYVDL